MTHDELAKIVGHHVPASIPEERGHGGAWFTYAQMRELVDEYAIARRLAEAVDAFEAAGGEILGSRWYEDRGGDDALTAYREAKKP
jgi:hypothetical protein